MKKFSLIISVLALVMGLSQCQKRPDMPTFGLGKTTPKEITFSVNGNGGQKGDFTQVTSALDYTWRTGDKIYVYASGEPLADGNQTDFSAGKFCGVMNMTSGADKKQAKFEGLINVPEATKTLRFVHYGTGVTLEGDATDGYSGSASFAEQNGKLTGDNSISSKVIALCDMEYDEGQDDYGVESLTVQFAVVRFTFEVFEGTNDVTLSQLAKNGLKVNATGAVEYTDGATSTLSGMTAENRSQYYTVLMPKGNTKYHIISDGKIAYKEAAIEIGKFYTKAGAPGESVSIDLIQDVLPREFSVAPDKQVYFSKGSLQFLPCGLPAVVGSYVDMFRFADNQWDYLGDGEDWGVKLEGYTEYNKPDGTRSAARDLFGWGTACLEGNSVPWQCAMDNSLYGPASGDLNDGEASGTNYEKYDWGHLMTPANTWRTLSNSEFEYLFKGRDGNYDYGSQGNRTLGGYGDLTLSDGSPRYGVFILPDDYYRTADERPTYTTKTGWAYTTSQINTYGIVFLPVGGYREGSELIHIGTGGHFWTSTEKGDAYAIIIDYNTSGLQIDFAKEFNRYEGANVRLVLNK